MFSFDVKDKIYYIEKYSELLNELSKKNPDISLGEKGLEAGNTSIKNLSLEEQQRERIRLNFEVLKFLHFGLIQGAFSSVEGLEKLKKMRVFVINKLFQNNEWMRYALDTIISMPKDTKDVNYLTQVGYVEGILHDYHKDLFDSKTQTFKTSFIKPFSAYHIPYNASSPWYKKVTSVVMTALGNLLKFMKASKLSLWFLRKGVELNPNDPVKRGHLAEAYQENNQIDGAVEHWIAACKLDAVNPEYQKSLIEALNKKNDANYSTTVIYEMLLLDSKHHTFKKTLCTYSPKQKNNEFEVKAERIKPKKIIADIPNTGASDSKILKTKPLKKNKEDKNNEEIEKEFQNYLSFYMSINKQPLTEQDIESMKARWSKQASSPYFHGQYAKQKLWDQVLAYSMKAPSHIKKNFAHMHAEAQLNQQSELKIQAGGSKQLTWPYLKFFLEKNTKEFGLETFDKHLKQMIDEYQEMYFAHKSLYSTAALKGNMTQDIIAERTKLINIETQNHIKNITALSPGQDYIMLGNWYLSNNKGAHAISYVVSRQDDGKFSFSIANSGYGINKHQHRTCAMITKAEESEKTQGSDNDMKAKDKKDKYKIVQMKEKFMPYYKIKDIPAEKMLNVNIIKELVEMTRGVKPLASANDFYDGFLNKLNGVREKNTKPNVQDLITPQRSGSCVWSLYMALLRMNLSFADYKRLVFTIKAQSLIHFYETFKGSLKIDLQAKSLLTIAVKEYENRIIKIQLQIGKDAYEQLLSPQEKEKLKAIIKEVNCY